MAFVKIDEIPNRRRFSIDQKGVRKYTRVWMVQTDTMLYDSLAACSAPGIPPLYAVYLSDVAYDTQAVVINLSATEDSENPFLWHVEVSYSSERSRETWSSSAPSSGTGTGPSSGTAFPNQAAALARIAAVPKTMKWSNETVKQVAEFDVITNDPIVNSALMAFDPPPEYDVAVRVLTITRNEEFFVPNYFDDFAYTLNDAPIFGYGTEQGRMEPIDGEEQHESGFNFWKVTYVIKFRKDAVGWKLRPLDQGPYELDDDDEWIAVRDKSGLAMNGPGLLDGFGRQINPAGPNPVPTYLPFDVYLPEDWAPLNLDP